MPFRIQVNIQTKNTQILPSPYFAVIVFTPTYTATIIFAVFWISNTVPLTDIKFGEPTSLTGLNMSNGFT